MTIGRNWLCAVAALSMVAGGPASAQVFKAVNFESHPQPAKIAGDGAEVTLSPLSDGDGMIKASAAIKIPGYPALVVTEDEPASPAYDRWVGIGKLSVADPAPSVVLQGFTGGAHCCATMTVVTPFEGALKTLTLESIDGEGTDSFPTDIDKDGTVDFYRQDDSFRYEFASGAGSYSPPVLFNVRDGALVNVSSEPRFKAFWEDYAKEARGLCADQENFERNSPCAAYVVAGIHLGRFEATLRDALTLADRDYAEPLERCGAALVEDACPAGAELKFTTFEAHLRWLLKQDSYID